MYTFIKKAKLSLIIAAAILLAQVTYAGSLSNLDTTPTNIQYTTFNANFYQNGAIVSWITTDAPDDGYFEVERSFDAETFTTAGLVLDAETSVDNYKNYRFKDNANVLKNKNEIYYRLKLITKNGNFTYSNVISITKTVASTKGLQASPNPTNQNINIKFNATVAEKAMLKCININGNVAFTMPIEMVKGTNNVAINNTTNLTAGTYFVQINVNGKVVYSQKIIKQ